MSENDVARHEPSLPELLRARARRASDVRLALDTGLGLVAAIVIVAWRPWGWIPLLAAAGCFATFGLWGILDRELLERSSKHPGLLRAGRILAAVLGTLSATALGLSLFFSALGMWKS